MGISIRIKVKLPKKSGKYGATSISASLFTNHRMQDKIFHNFCRNRKSGSSRVFIINCWEKRGSKTDRGCNLSCMGGYRNLLKITLPSRQRMFLCKFRKTKEPLLFYFCYHLRICTDNKVSFSKVQGALFNYL